MLKLGSLVVNVTHIPQDVKDITSRWMKTGQTIKDDFNSDIVKSAAAYVPEGEVARELVINIVDAGIKSLKALHDLADSEGFNGRLLTLSTEITKIQHEAENQPVHNWGFYIHCAQMVWDDLFSQHKP